MNKVTKRKFYHIGLIMGGILCFNTAMLFASQNPAVKFEKTATSEDKKAFKLAKQELK